jgi:hypothetical protein
MKTWNEIRALGLGRHKGEVQKCVRACGEVEAKAAEIKHAAGRLERDASHEIRKTVETERARLTMMERIARGVAKATAMALVGQLRRRDWNCEEICAELARLGHPLDLTCVDGACVDVDEYYLKTPCHCDPEKRPEHHGRTGDARCTGCWRKLSV